MAERLKIGFDVDDVLVRTAARMVELYNARHGTSLTENDWYLFDDISRWGVESLPEAARRVVDIFGTDEFIETVEEMEGARIVLEHLKVNRHDLLAVTGRPESLRPQTVDVVARVFPGVFPNDSIYFTDHFAEGGAKITKGQIGRELELTHFVDDQIEHAETLAVAGIKTVLFGDNYKWNQGNISSMITRVNSWQELGGYFDREAGYDELSR